MPPGFARSSMPKFGTRVRIRPSRASFDGWCGTCGGASPTRFAVHPMVSGSVPGHEVGRSAIDGVWLNATGGEPREGTPRGDLIHAVIDVVLHGARRVGLVVDRLDELVSERGGTGQRRVGVGSRIFSR
jgi:hypothetical protein